MLSERKRCLTDEAVVLPRGYLNLSSGSSVKARPKYNPRQDQSSSELTKHTSQEHWLPKRKVSPHQDDQPSLPSCLAFEEVTLE